MQRRRARCLILLERGRIAISFLLLFLLVVVLLDLQSSVCVENRVSSVCQDLWITQ